MDQAESLELDLATASTCISERRQRMFALRLRTASSSASSFRNLPSRCLFGCEAPVGQLASRRYATSTPAKDPLVTQLQSGLKDAMKAKDSFRAQVIKVRLILVFRVDFPTRYLPFAKPSSRSYRARLRTFRHSNIRRSLPRPYRPSFPRYRNAKRRSRFTKTKTGRIS